MSGAWDVLLITAAFAAGWWLGVKGEQQAARARQPRCPRCEGPLAPPRPVDPGRRWR